jgi:carbamoyl-phosphate synthase large subunit
MIKMKRILVTGAGGPAGVNFIKSLRIAPEKFFIVGTDVNKYYLELPDVDVRQIAIPCTHPKYIEFLNDVIERYNIEMVHPQPDIEVRVISENREKIKAITFLPKKETIRICQDKLESAKIWAKEGIPVAKAIEIKDEDSIEEAAEELSLPFWIRATSGAGGRGSTPCYNIEMGKAWIRYWRSRGENWKFIAQEYLPGRNLAFHSIWKNGELIVSQVRERLEYIYPHLAPSGITGTPSVAVTVNRPDVDKIATECILAIDKNPTGIFCVDLKENKNGIPCPTEINAGRFFTTSLFFSVAGLNMPYIYVKLAYNEEIPPLKKYNALGEGYYWIRHMDSGPILLKEGEWRSIGLWKQYSLT